MLGPIFTREFLTLPRRPRHHLVRAAFLGGLWILLLTIWQTTVGWEINATIGELARFGVLAFQIIANVQLVLLLFFSSLAAASAIAQEKDRRTFVLLLLTDLRNRELVLGKTLGSLLEILLLLATMAPILALLVLLGGIAPRQVFEVALVLGMTALAAASLGGLVALWRDKTFQALALTVLLLVLYLVAVQVLSFLPFGNPEDLARWQSWLQPFLALNAVLSPDADNLHASPAVGFSMAMLGWTILLNGIGMWRLRVWNPSGEPIMQREKIDAPAEERDRLQAHAAPGKARGVWANPILWREIATRAYGRRPLLVKLAYFLVLGLICYFALGPAGPSSWAAATGLVPVIILSLLLVCAQAVTAITSERDVGALDLLLVTDLSPREFIFGKLLGILYNTKEFLLPPWILASVYALRGQLATPAWNHPELWLGKNIEALVFTLLGLAVLFFFTIVLGLHVALRIEKSRFAIVRALGTIFLLSIGTLISIYLIVINGRFEYQWLSFSMFLFAGVGGLWWVLSGNHPTTALTLAAWICPLAVFYSITNLLVGQPAYGESSDPLIPFLVLGGAFGFATAAMLVPLLSEFDIAMGRTSAGGD